MTAKEAAGENPPPVSHVPRQRRVCRLPSFHSMSKPLYLQHTMPHFRLVLPTAEYNRPPRRNGRRETRNHNSETERCHGGECKRQRPRQQRKGSSRSERGKERGWCA